MGQSGVAVELVTDETNPYFGSLKFPGLEEVWLKKMSSTTYSEQSFFKVYTENPTDNLPPLLGKIKVENGLLYFTPRFPFTQGRTYWVLTNFAEKTLLIPVAIPEPTLKTAPQVLAIYPSAKQWPANQLKFYICFDQPMRFGEAYQYIQIIEEGGKTLDTPFLEMEQELWNKAQTRLTVWFDPGRVKQSLIPNEQKGMPLSKGRKYQLIINKEWLALNGLSLHQDYNKSFEVITADHSQPNPNNWKTKIPAPDTKNALELEFPEGMDYALLLSGIGVLNEMGEAIFGRIELKNEEKSWLFYPTDSWKSGNYILRVSTDVEDLAGNNLERLFDSEYQKEEKERVQEKSFIDLQIKIK